MSEEMNETRPEVTAKLEDSNLRMRKLFQEVAAAAEMALANQPEGTRECWLHFNKAVHDIRKLMRPKPGTLAFTEERWWYDTNERGTEAASPRYQGAGLGPVDPAAVERRVHHAEGRYSRPCAEGGGGAAREADQPDAPEMVRRGKMAIGNFTGKGKVVSYAIDEMYAITVTASRTGDGVWTFKGIKDGETEIMGTILGGKPKAMRFCKFIRNGIVSRANRLYHCHHKTKAAAALAGAPSDAAGAEGTEAANPPCHED